MPYEIFVFVREVWDTRDLVVDPLDSSGAIRESVLSCRFEPEDLNALEMALKVKDSDGSRVTVMAFGPPREVDVLRESLYRGVDRVFRIEGSGIEGLDAFSKACAIERALKVVGKFDLMLFGVDVVEGENAQIGSHLAGILGLPQATYVESLESIKDGFVTCKRAIEGGMEEVILPLPAILTVGVALLVDDPRAPRPAKAKLKLLHKKTQIPSIQLEELVTPKVLVLERIPMPAREIESKDIDPEDERALMRMIEELKEERILR
jgi:electron transfer flavoprotein beta subunit